MDYREKLIEFIKPVPIGGGKVESGTPTWQHEKMRYTQEQVDALKTDQYFDNPVFTKLTSRGHKDLLGQWISNKTTTCNEFVTQCAAKMGWTGSGLLDAKKKPLPGALGRFDIADQLERWGMSDCWVSATSGAVPQFGDLFKCLGPQPTSGMRTNHMGVALDYHEGSRTLNTVESGQGGSSVGYDAVARKTRNWPDKEVVGWVSIAAVLASKKPVDYWMGGWWIVQEEFYPTSFYYFAAGDRVFYTTRKPGSVVSPPDASAITGTYRKSKKQGGRLEITWLSTDVDEIWDQASISDKQRNWTMTGRTTLGRTMKAKRWVSADKDDPNAEAGVMPKL